MSKTLQEWARSSRVNLALVFTDIVHSTSLGNALGDESWINVLTKHFRRARHLIRQYDSHEIKVIGDSFMIAFRNVDEALDFAMAFQADTGDKRIRIRVGIHAGLVRVIENDIYGLMVNETARIAAWPKEDWIVLSNDAKKYIDEESEAQPSSLRFERFTSQLKGFSEPLTLWRVSKREKKEVIAVLPFKATGTEETGNESLGLESADAIIIRLNKIGHLIVRPTSAISKYGRQDQNPLEAGRELAADYVLEGRVHRAGGRVSTTAQLLNVRDSAKLWGKKYEQNVDDIFVVENQISEQVVRKLRLRLSSAERERLTKRYTKNVKAYQLYILGRFFRNQFTEESLIKAIRSFHRAKKLDPNYAKAYAGIADCYIWLGIYNLLPPKETFAKAKKWASQALEIDNTIAGAHTSLAYTKMFNDWDWSGAEEEFKQAIELNPNHATAYQGYAHLLGAMGRFEEALAEINQAIEIDPTSSIINVVKGIILYEARKYDQSLEQFGKVVELDPTFDAAYYGLALAYEQKGLFKDAIATSRKAIALSHHNPLKITVLAHIYAMSNAKAKAQKELSKLENLAKQRYVSPFHMALIYAAIDEQDQAFECLQEAYNNNDQWLVLLQVEPRLDSIRSDPRFTRLIRRMKFPLIN